MRFWTTLNYTLNYNFHFLFFLFFCLSCTISQRCEECSRVALWRQFMWKEPYLILHDLQTRVQKTLLIPVKQTEPRSAPEALVTVSSVPVPCSDKARSTFLQLFMHLERLAINGLALECHLINFSDFVTLTRVAVALWGKQQALVFCMILSPLKEVSS